MDDAVEVLRCDARAILQRAISAADPGLCVERAMKIQRGRLSVGGTVYNLDDYDEILVVGAGKAAVPMAEAVERMLPGRIGGGLISTKYGHGRPLQWVEVNECGHPVPDEAGLAGAQRILELACGAGDGTLILCLISGGGSALLPLPADGISLQEKQDTTGILLGSGVPIDEINIVRKHLSRIKGGQLSRAAAPAAILSLVMSDVIGDPLDAIASGPTVPDRSTFGESAAILERYGLRDRLPASVCRRIDRGVAGDVDETPKPGDRIFDRCRTVIVGNNRMALSAAKEAALDLGYQPFLLTSAMRGEARETALFPVAIGSEILRSGEPVSRPACLIAGGETTVTLRGSGKGGRNQEFALSAAIALDGLDGVVVLCAGTDGTDGPTDAAGAICDGKTAERAGLLGMAPLRYLDANDSYPFFSALGDLVITGPTGTNVMDVVLVLVA